MKWTALLRLFHSRNFPLLWGGEFISTLGDRFHLMALPWLALELSGSGTALGLVLMMSMLPRAILTLYGGVLTDRMCPRRLMLIANIGRAVVTAWLATRVLTDTLDMWELYVIALVFGTFDAFFYPAYSALLPQIVDMDQLAVGNAMLQGTAQFNSLIGPAMAGVAIAGLGIGTVLIFDVASFIVSICTLTLLRVPAKQRSAFSEDGSQPARMWQAAKEGFSYVARHKVIRVMLLPLAAINLCVSGPFLVGTTWLAKYHFGRPEVYGTLLSAFALGSIAGTLITGAIKPHNRLGPAIIGPSVILGLTLAALGLPLTQWMAMCAMFSAGAAAGFISVFVISVVQKSTSPQLLGRVLSMVMFSSAALTPVSYLAAGLVIKWGASWLFLGASAALLCLTLFASISRSLWIKTSDLETSAAADAA